MEMYNALVEVKSRLEGAALERAAEKLVDQLADYHPAVSTSPRGWLEARISLPAESLAQAASTAAAVVSAAAGAEPIACEVMTEAEFDAREGWMPVPDLVSVTEAAQLLGVSRQAILDRINRHTLPAEKVGNGWAISRAALEVDRA